MTFDDCECDHSYKPDLLYDECRIQKYDTPPTQDPLDVLPLEWHAFIQYYYTPVASIGTTTIISNQEPDIVTH